MQVSRYPSVQHLREYYQFRPDTLLKEKIQTLALWIFSVLIPLVPAIAFFVCWMKDSCQKEVLSSEEQSSTHPTPKSQAPPPTSISAVNLTQDPLDKAIPVDRATTPLHTPKPIICGYILRLLANLSPEGMKKFREQTSALQQEDRELSSRYPTHRTNTSGALPKIEEIQV